jgi:hypothetical protein
VITLGLVSYELPGVSELVNYAGRLSPILARSFNSRAD